MPVKTPPKKQPNSSKQAKATEEELSTKPDITRVVRSSEGLPDGWRWVKLGDVCERITKGGTPTTYGYKFQRNGVTFFEIHEPLQK